MRTLNYLILCLCLLSPPRAAKSQEHCFKFSFQLLSGLSNPVDTISQGDCLRGRFNILNCSNAPAIVFDWVYEITDESDNDFYCNWYKITKGDTIPYNDYYAHSKSSMHSSDLEPFCNLVDTIKANERKTYRHDLRFFETLFMDTGSYCLKVAWKYKVNHAGSYYLQESENMEHVYITKYKNKY